MPKNGDTCHQTGWHTQNSLQLPPCRLSKGSVNPSRLSSRDWYHCRFALSLFYGFNGLSIANKGIDNNLVNLYLVSTYSMIWLLMAPV